MKVELSLPLESCTHALCLTSEAFRHTLLFLWEYPSVTKCSAQERKYFKIELKIPWQENFTS